VIGFIGASPDDRSSVTPHQRFSYQALIALMHREARKRYHAIETILPRRLMLLAESSTFTTPLPL
jgi:hypothetical protein